MQLNQPAAFWWASLGVFATVSAITVAATPQPNHEKNPPTQQTAAPDTSQSDAPSDNAAPSANRFTTTILGPSQPPGIPTGEVDRFGNPVLASCQTCHTTREANRATRDGRQLTEFHQGLVTNHGGLQCVACHNADDYSQLQLAGGKGVSFEESMTLCAQCHGPQYRDYQHGAHGGMNGYWDLARGPRTRNHCLACHDAHAPPYQPVLPVFPPHQKQPAVPHEGGQG